MEALSGEVPIEGLAYVLDARLAQLPTAATRRVETFDRFGEGFDIRQPEILARRNGDESSGLDENPAWSYDLGDG